jgi:hypothetical protein
MSVGPFQEDTNRFLRESMKSLESRIRNHLKVCTVHTKVVAQGGLVLAWEVSYSRLVLPAAQT